MNKTNLLDLEWKNLIILDACRYDTFEKINFIRGDLKKIKSLGSCTGDWRDNTFTNRYIHTMDYYSANPFLSR